MARILNAKYRNCEIASSGPVAALGNINAPIRRCKLTSEQIISILRQGFIVYEYNPGDPSEKKELTLTNNGASPFIGVPAPEKKPKESPIIEPVNPTTEPTNDVEKNDVPETEEAPAEDIMPEAVVETPEKAVVEVDNTTEEQPVNGTPIVIETAAQKEVAPTEKPTQTGPDFSKKGKKKK